jgi:hypothetical protein
MDTSPRHDDPAAARPGPGTPLRRRRSAIAGTVAGLVAIGSAGGVLVSHDRPVPVTASAATPRPSHGGAGDHRTRTGAGDAVLGLPVSRSTGTAAGGRSRSDVVTPGAPPFPPTSSPITAVFV